ncbi:hypothetical protein SKAU_G00282600 [Synaphobranchus kaupii]|uniref:Uncharacterized protein n=1 Tax=Synaphobranchus kaupii TaxID=118154 RepID=A0A9Q1EXL2_SYNKA|nr:hypothetical protein SKAU_G00282600 [Synaphobranchus kaupii]
MAMLTDSEQKLAEELIQLLKPLKTVTTLMSSETTPTTSMILPLKEMILKSMAPGDEDSATLKEAKAAITQDLERRYTDPALHDYLQRATALDPRFKSLPSLDESSRVRLYRDLTTDILEHEQQVRARAGWSNDAARKHSRASAAQITAKHSANRPVVDLDGSAQSFDKHPQMEHGQAVGYGRSSTAGDSATECHG